MKQSNRFAGQVAVVTGGASGIGHEVAGQLAAEGARIVVWDRQQSDIGETRLLDITDAGDTARAAEEIMERHGRLDILVASAGITGPNATTWDYPVADWASVIQVNLLGMFHCCRAVVPPMLKGNYGRIVALASVAGKEGNPNAGAYSASKAGVIGLIKSLGKELATTGVRANCLAPAAVRTPLFAQMKQEHIDYMLSKIPMGRFGELDEISAMVCWMASPECSFTTGAVFDATGGRATF
ncbi:SDR family NAD(P)-dependent oxidoreductase [Ferrovibrio sp.]|uniref:SDR family NAD(P)-dependent oxidoreductase n=1 Tax=Ferrovibrio sp. TaxID=1917215 RepID=UPI000CCAC21F|nr:SDR family NAD(P)-dependent oxidoreductase [Ferrovibrio sp.]PJI42181.1 MAG: 3-oxoacyl-ACP reductase [Ferrovibrio sp.]